MLSAKRLEKTLSQLERSDKELITKHFNYLWETYWSESEYYRTLKDNGRITYGQYRKAVLPKLRKVRDELYETARTLKAI